jgi:hypothetical protein
MRSEQTWQRGAKQTWVSEASEEAAHLKKQWFLKFLDNKLMLPLGKLTLCWLLSLLEDSGVGLPIFEQTNHRAESDTTVSLSELKHIFSL